MGIIERRDSALTLPLNKNPRRTRRDLDLIFLSARRATHPLMKPSIQRRPERLIFENLPRYRFTPYHVEKRNAEFRRNFRLPWPVGLTSDAEVNSSSRKSAF